MKLHSTTTKRKCKKATPFALHAANYLKDAKDMNFYQKLNGFERLNSLNERATTKTLHVSLNFDPSEKLAETKLLKLHLPTWRRLVLANNLFWFTNMKMQGIRTFTL
ncbi:MAG: hypothetical protein V9F02_04520 [Chitinophagaceae bacterium]